MISIIARRLFCNELSYYIKAKAAAGIIRKLSSMEPLAKTNWELKNVSPGTSDLMLSEILLNDLQRQNPDNPALLKFFRDMFDPAIGVQLPPRFITQKRNQDGGVPGIFTFYPNRIVTPLVFNMLNNTRTRTLLIGQTGIAKTSAIIFYSYLANLVIEYDVMANQTYDDITRVIYLSYNKSIKDETQIKKVILGQIAGQANMDIDDSLDQIKNKFKSVFSRYKLKVVLDQYNMLAAVQNKSLTDVQQKKQIKWWFKTCMSLFNDQPVLYISTVVIQDQELMKRKPPLISMPLHSPIKKYSVQQFNYTKRDLIKKECIRTVAFQFQRKLKVSTQTVQQAVQLCFKEIEKIDDSYYLFSHQQIRQEVAKYLKDGKLNELAAQNIKESIITFLRQFGSKLVQAQQEKSKKIYQSSEYNSLMFAFTAQIVQKALQCRGDQSKWTPHIKFSSYKQMIKKIKVIKKELDEDLFKLHYSKETGLIETVEVKPPLKLFIEITQPINQLLFKIQHRKLQKMWHYLSSQMLTKILKQTLFQCMRISPLLFQQNQYRYYVDFVSYFKHCNPSHLQRLNRFISKQQWDNLPPEYFQKPCQDSQFDLMIWNNKKEKKLVTIDFLVTDDRNKVEQKINQAEIFMKKYGEKFNRDWTHLIIQTHGLSRAPRQFKVLVNKINRKFRIVCSMQIQVGPEIQTNFGELAVGILKRSGEQNNPD